MDILTLAGLQIQRGVISSITREGYLHVGSDQENAEIPCEVLRTSTAPLPDFKVYDRVLFVTDEAGARGYVLGIIETMRPAENWPIDKPAGAENVERRLSLQAEERLELRCGECSLIMRDDGKVILKGNTILSRARQTNKIKGAAVQIN